MNSYQARGGKLCSFVANRGQARNDSRESDWCVWLRLRYHLATGVQKEATGFSKSLAGNLAVLLAALGVFGTGTGWPDIIVGTIMAALALQGSATVARQALAELRHSRTVAVQATTADP
jgi:hypothetical protein